MNVFTFYFFVSSIIIGIIYYSINKLLAFNTDYYNLIDYTNKYKYLAYTTDVISVFTDNTVFDPNESYETSNPDEKWRCVLMTNSSTQSSYYTPASNKGYISNSPSAITLTYNTQHLCIMSLFDILSTKSIDIYSIYNPCLVPNSANCTRLRNAVGF